MVAELRWILLGLCLLLLAVIWWWSARRTGQAPGNAELRESTAGTTPHIAPPLDPRYLDPDDDDTGPAAEARDWGVPPFEPLSIRTAEFDRVPVLDRPMMVNADPEPRAAAAPAGRALPRNEAIIQKVPAILPRVKSGQGETVHPVAWFEPQ